MTALTPKTAQSLRQALYAYIGQYGGGESIPQVRAIAGSLLSVRAKAGAIVFQGLEMEAWVDELVVDFDPSRVAEQAWTEGEQAIATQAKHWREALEVKARATLDAYIQTHVPNLETPQIQALITTILPIVEDVQISRDEAKRLIHLIRDEFDWQTAAQRILDPKWVAFANQVAQVARNQAVEATVQDTVRAYMVTFKPTLVEIGEGLVETALSAVINNKAKLGLDLALDPESQRLMVKQISFKLKLMEASASPSKTILEMAQQIHDEVARYRAAQGIDTPTYIPPLLQKDEPTGNSVLGGEISIGVEVHPRSDRAKNPTEEGTPPKN
ncbi:MAG: hypothetical protein F6J95_010485 [Leptolyngbya sp. SIO1E4]|nr:hypothetical protein [Leptolyngbya sp. SIO1E4]